MTGCMVPCNQKPIANGYPCVIPLPILPDWQGWRNTTKGYKNGDRDGRLARKVEMRPITSFEDWVKQRRKELDMTQAQLAARAGYAVVTIRKIEQATRRPSRQMAELLAEALAIPEAQRDAFLRMARHQYIDPSSVPQPVSETPSPLRPGPLDATVDIAEQNYFVERAREMVQLDAHLTSALNGSGRIVFITGEAGYGKTTLMAEFARQAMTTYPDLIVASGDCEAYAGAGDPYLPFRDVMAMLTGDVESSGRIHMLSESQTRRLWALLPLCTQTLVDHGPDLIDVLVSGTRLRQCVMTHPIAADRCRAQLEVLASHPAQAQDVPQRKLFEQVAQMLRALSKHNPLLLLLDDLQWIDHASADLLSYMAARLGSSRIMFLGTFRRSEVELKDISSDTGATPTEAHALMRLLQELKRRYGDVEIDLDQATSQAGRAFVDALLDSEPNLLAEPFRAELFQRTRGHPLFTVELLHDFQERGDLTRDAQGRWINAGDIDWALLPARVEAVISRRISRLPPLLQEALKTASVEGETFTAEVIARILEVDDWEMVRQLSGIAGRQHRLIIAQGNQRLGDQRLSRYRFGHILFQNYLYGNLDPSERAYLHEAVGHTLEQLASDHRETVAIQLAHHYQVAGLTAKAIDYLSVAGRQAMAVSAHREAITHHTRALSLTKELPKTRENVRLELQLHTDLGVSYKITKGFAAPEVERSYDRAQDLCEQVDDPAAQACVLWGLASVHAVLGEMGKAYSSAEKLMRFSTGREDPALEVAAHFTLGSALIHMGQLKLAQSHLQKALAAYSPAQHRTHIFLAGLDLGVFSLAHLAHALLLLGRIDQALQTAQEAVTLAQVTSHPFSNVSALCYLTMLHQWRGDRLAVQELASVSRQLCDEHDIPYYAAWASFLEGWAMVEPHHIEQGIQQMEQSLADLQSMRVGLRRQYYLCLLAEKYGAVGRIDEGLRVLEHALGQARAQGQTLFVPDVSRIQGELLWEQGADHELVEACFRRALKMAHSQEAKLLELRAVTSLARLYKRQGRGAAMRGTLAAVIDLFDENAETADLQAARTVLATLV